MTNWLGKLVSEEVGPHDTVLDLGCGNLQAAGRLGACHLAVDAFMPYLEEIKKSGPTLLADIATVTFRFPDKSYDVVLLLDVLEHLPQDQHLSVIAGAERIARKRVIVYSPDGMMPQDACDAWGLGMNPLQEHISSVSADEFRAAGYTITYFGATDKSGKKHRTFFGVKTF